MRTFIFPTIHQTWNLKIWWSCNIQIRQAWFYIVDSLFSIFVLQQISKNDYKKSLKIPKIEGQDNIMDTRKVNKTNNDYTNKNNKRLSNTNPIIKNLQVRTQAVRSLPIISMISKCSYVNSLLYWLFFIKSWSRYLQTVCIINIYTVKPAHAVTFIKQPLVLKGHFFLLLS
jgi:hypothetical protein